ncbi:MAG: hypothetical protein JW940_23520 [Polyangiaceae bacterium]|nr:hypothetical protein [Polyangiaceae bacterium]
MMDCRTDWLVASIIALFGVAACSDTADPISLGNNDKDASDSTEQPGTGGSEAAAAAGAPDAGKSESGAAGGAPGDVEPTGGRTSAKPTGGAPGDVEPTGGRTSAKPTGGAPGGGDGGKATGGAAGAAQSDAGPADASSPDPGTGGAPDAGTGGSAGGEPQGGTSSQPDAGPLGRGVEIYKVHGYEYTGGDLSYQSFDPQEVELEATPVVGDSEILSYDPGSHVFDLTFSLDELRTRVGSIPVHGEPFVLTADAERILGGWFWTAISSVSCWTCITLEPDFPVEVRDQSKIELECGYPRTIERPSPDPREDPRLIDRLKADGRLLEPLPLVYGIVEISSGSYSPGTAERAIVDRFIVDKSPDDQPDTGSYVFVELLPDGDLYQRPVDLVLLDAGLSAFVSTMEDGEPTYQPDTVWRIPLETIDLDLLELGSDLGVEQPRVSLGEASYLQDRAF